MIRTSRTKVVWVLIVFATLVALPSAALAGGVEIQEQGAKGLGNSFAGAQAVGEDPSTVWWNPAGMARLDRSALAAAGTVILARGDFVDGGSLRLPGVPFTGESGTTDEPVGVPAFYGVWRLSRKVSLGLSVNAPYGLVTEWGRSWIGRYHGTRSELLSLNINPSFSYRFNNCWSVGAGISAMWTQAELGNAIDFGALAQAPQTMDGHATVKGDSWGIGYNVGVLWEPSCRTRVGLHYRSRVSQELDGDADFEVPPPLAPALRRMGRFQDGNAKADFVYPDQIALGAAHDLNRKWTLQASVVWTNWSLWRELRVRFENPDEPDAVSPLDWDDTWRVAIGATFRPSRCWTVRCGVQWDQSPIPDETRTPRIPMNDRYWISAGVGYQIGHHLVLDLGYAHLFIDKGPMDLASAEAGALVGESDGQVDIVSLQATWTF